MNTCPVDRLKFNRIDVYTSLNDSPIRNVMAYQGYSQFFLLVLTFILFQVQVPDVSLGSSTSEDLTYCEVRVYFILMNYSMFVCACAACICVHACMCIVLYVCVCVCVSVRIMMAGLWSVFLYQVAVVTTALHPLCIMCRVHVDRKHQV